AALSGSFESLLAMTALFAIIGDGAVYLALFVLRRKEPGLNRPFKAYGYPVLPAIVLLVAVVFLVGYLVSNPVNSLIALGIVALFYPAFRLLKRVSQ
ncbi:MAG TPA: amino acid transporter, partial [Blastocatellia bacterium]|nr:amino acid transporter [Blastocatellia bacterium]